MLAIIFDFIKWLWGVVYPTASNLKDNKEMEDVAKAYSKQAEQIQKNETMDDDELVDNIVDINERLRK